MSHSTFLLDMALPPDVGFVVAAHPHKMYLGRRSILHDSTPKRKPVFSGVIASRAGLITIREYHN
ncbi:hypothetical protein [Longimicrobium sp.]|uniref:hypothetical protein n=1 Tax=Longimicrobium sp. TaxID=2029185 RepID=UPI002F9300D3